jgi:hypothetical protein
VSEGRFPSHKVKAIKTVAPPNAEMPKRAENPHHAAAIERGKAAVRKLQEQEIIDSQGRRIRTDLPNDMQKSKDRDFGG